MIRIIKITLITILCIVLWIAALFYIAPKYEEFPAWVFDLVLSLPIIIAALFGLYLLFCLIVGVKAFKTVPEEAENLQKDITRYVMSPAVSSSLDPVSFSSSSNNRAKKALKAKGISTASKKDE